MKNIFTRVSIFAAVIIIPGMTNSYAQGDRPATDGFIQYVPLPRGVSKADFLSGNPATRTSVSDYVKARVLNKIPKDSNTKHLDLIIIYTDQNGQPILPDKEKINTGGQSLRLNGNDLTYTFNSPVQPWSESQLATFQAYVNDLYPIIKNVVGPPLFNITVNVRRDSTLTGLAGYYDATINEFVLHNADDPDVFVHESIHAFRDDFIMGFGTYEEGMTRAGEVEVFNESAAYSSWNEFHQYSYDVYYEGFNRPNIACLQGNVWSNITLSFARYQISSYVWCKAFLEDHTFFQKFNDSLYARAIRDISTLWSESKLRNIFETIKPVMEGMPNATWYVRQHILNTMPPDGYYLFQRLNQGTIDFFYRNAGYEMPMSGITVSWQFFDYNNTLLDSGSDISAPYGWINFIPDIPFGYNWKGKVVASVPPNFGFITDTVYISHLQSGGSGVFGVVNDANTGTITLTALDNAIDPVTTDVVNGAFAFPGFKDLRGSFRYDIIYPDATHYSRIFTKDGSSYFLSIQKDPLTFVGLPVTWLNFSAKYQAHKVLLQWQTASEQHTDYFVIERSTDANLFTAIGDVKAAGDASTKQSYSFSDVGADQWGGKTLYYRLQEKDIDGQVNYSKVVRVFITGNKSEFIISPNPASDHIKIQLTNNAEPGKAQLIVFDANGRKVMTDNITLYNSSNIILVSLKQLPPGTYHLVIESGQTKWKGKFVKL